MDRPCYRCGSRVEENTTFCPGCGAPQIKVTLPDVPTSPTFTPPVPRAVPAVPLPSLPQREIQWKKFWRIALPFSLMNGVALVILGPYGILVFLAGVILPVSRYRRLHSGPLLASHGARLGAFTGFLTFLVALALGTLLALNNTGEIRQQISLAVQQRAAAHPDPNAQQVVQFMATNQGLMLVAIFAVIFSLVFCLALSSAAGALTAAFSSNKQRR